MLNVDRAKRVIVRCCSTQNTLLHVPPEHRRLRRVHGLQLPLHPQQVIGWMLLIVVFTGTFVVLLTTPPPLLANLRLALTPLFATLFLLHALTHLTVLLLDPAHPEVRAQPANQVVPEFDRTLHRHVIENGRCHLCNITTRGQRTKHCSICNKCVPRFDHHCKWLNHCIGGRNYPAFLACLASTLVTALAVAALALSQLVLINANLFVNGEHLRGDNNNDTSMNNVTASSPLWPAPGTGSLVLVTVVGVLSAIAAVLLIHLCFFHGYIACLGLTTYEYVRNKREKNIATGVATDDTRTTSSGDGTSSLFCRNSPLFRDNIGKTMTRVTTATTNVHVHSTHEEMRVSKDAAENGEDIFPKTLPSTRIMSETTESPDKTNSSRKANVWENLGSPRCIVAPMVDASELAWRLLSRRHGAQLCYTPMLHSSVFCRDPKYRREALTSTNEDRPLIVQFCGNDPKTLLEAARLAEPYCDAIDINIGCPQAIAKRGHYGAFLQDDWNLLRNIVSTLKNGLCVPVTCKLRVFPEIGRTVEYARMLEDAGASLLTVHGRTREQKGPLTGLASWKHIKAVRDAVKIPVIANGNIQCMQDLQRCIEEIQVQGVMSAEGNLYNPCIFESRYPACWEPALEYLELVERYPAPASYIRGHLFKLFHHVFCLAENQEERENLATNSTMEAFRSVACALRDRYLPYHEGHLTWQIEKTDYNLELPPWLCQPYVRELPQEHVQKLQEGASRKREYKDEDGNEISRKRSKKLKRIARRPNRMSVPKRSSNRCQDCPNPLGFKCEYKLCRQCCRSKCYIENLDCAGHRNLTKTRRQMAKEFEAKRKSIENVI